MKWEMTSVHRFTAQHGICIQNVLLQHSIMCQCMQIRMKTKLIFKTNLSPAGLFKWKLVTFMLTVKHRKIWWSCDNRLSWRQNNIIFAVMHWIRPWKPWNYFVRLLFAMFLPLQNKWFDWNYLWLFFFFLHVFRCLKPQLFICTFITL